MFEQNRYTDNRRARGLFRRGEGPAPGMDRFQVSGENDPAEIAADRMADSVVGGGGLFRSPEGSGGAGFQADLDTADLGDAGESLPMGLQSSLEQSFGAGFSSVRVHTGVGADRASRSISARAFTRGQDVYFRSGAYDPSSREGQHLIAHELAHVANGDGGIHREPDEEDNGSAARVNYWDMIETWTENIKLTQEDIGQANALISRCSRDKVMAQLTSGEASVEDVRGLADQAKGKEQSLDAWADSLKHTMEEYENGSGSESEMIEKELNRLYRRSRLLLTQAETAQKMLNEAVKPTLEKIVSDMDGGGGAQGVGFPETVARMMDDAACGQFFKAVDDIHKGKGDISAESFGSLNETAVKDAANLHGDVAESGAEKVGRIAGNVGAVAGIGASSADVISGGADIDEAANSENTHNENAGTSGTVIGLASGIVGTGTDIVGMAADAKALHDQESERKRKIQEMQKRNAGTGIGKASVVDHTARAAVAGSALGVLGGTAGIVSSSADLANDEKTSDIAGLTSASLGTAGDVFGLATDSQNAKERRDKDREAKQNMRALGKQLRATLPSSGILTEKNTLVLQISDKLNGEKFNAKGSEHLGTLIDRALDTSTPNANTGTGTNAGSNAQTSTRTNAALQGELSAKQRNLLVTLKALETSRMANKGAISDAKKDVGFSIASLAGSLTSLAGSIASMAGSKLVGSILSMVGTAIGIVGTVRDAMGLGEKKADRQKDRNDDRDAKVAACQAAVGQMAALPALPLDVLKLKREKKVPLSGEQQAAAEQYASVFTLIKTADVDMVDFLYAVDQGNFGGKDEHGADISAADSLKAMYGKLDFS